MEVIVVGIGNPRRQARAHVLAFLVAGQELEITDLVHLRVPVREFLPSPIGLIVDDGDVQPPPVGVVPQLRRLQRHALPHLAEADDDQVHAARIVSAEPGRLQGVAASSERALFWKLLKILASNLSSGADNRSWRSSSWQSLSPTTCT